MNQSQPVAHITKAQLADLLSISMRTLENWVVKGEVPAPAAIEVCVYWHPEAIVSWQRKLFKLGDPEEGDDIPTAPPKPRRGPPRNRPH